MEEPLFMEDLFEFGSDCENDDDRLRNGTACSREHRKSSSFTPTALGSALLTVLHHHDDPSRPFADSTLVEEELEWISNKDAFPAVETFPDFLSIHEMFLPAKQNSPVSVLETPTIPHAITTASNSNSSSGSGSIVTNCCGGLRVPGKARSKRRTRQQQCTWLKCREMFVKKAEPPVSSLLVGRKCQHCGVDNTPQWRAGPLGPKTLCNACGVRFKSGRLVPEYRPANSPTFCSELHSNSHRKVVEMRRQKEMMGLTVVKPIDKGVG